MNRTEIDTALRLLDPAGHGDATARDHSRPELVLSDLPSVGMPATAVVRPPRGLPARRLAVLGGAVAAATAALVVAPNLTGGDTAFATWTASPDGLTAQQRDEAGESCRQAQREGAGSGYVDRLERADVAVAERRGSWTTVLLGDDQGFSALCVTDDSAGWFSDTMIGSVGVAAVDAPPPGGVVATDLGTGTVGQGDVSLVAGAAGADVVGVSYVSAEHGTVAATVSQGRFALWFPGDELVGANPGGIDVEVTLADGTTTTARLAL